MFSEKFIKEEESNKNMISIEKVNYILDKALPDKEDASVNKMPAALNLNRILLRNIVIAYFDDIKIEELNKESKIDNFKELYKIMIEKSKLKEELKTELLAKINSLSNKNSQKEILDSLELNSLDSELSIEIDRIFEEIISKNEKKSKIDAYISLMD